jgi:hypothetical protein
MGVRDVYGVVAECRGLWLAGALEVTGEPHLEVRSRAVYLLEEAGAGRGYQAVRGRRWILPVRQPAIISRRLAVEGDDALAVEFREVPIGGECEAGGPGVQGAVELIVSAEQAEEAARVIVCVASRLPHCHFRGHRMRLQDRQVSQSGHKLFVAGSAATKVVAVLVASPQQAN